MTFEIRLRRGEQVKEIGQDIDTKNWSTPMRLRLSLASTILALSLSTGASAEQNGWQIFSEPFVATAHAQEADWQKVDEALGRKPAVTGDVHRYGFPRTDLTVTLDGVTIKPALAGVP